jgi:hypothetical protein
MIPTDAVIYFKNATAEVKLFAKYGYDLTNHIWIDIEGI